MAVMVLFNRLHRFSQAILAVRFPDSCVMGNSWLLNAGVKEAARQGPTHKFCDYKQLQKRQLYI